jgi:hypothetical protein
LSFADVGEQGFTLFFRPTDVAVLDAVDLQNELVALLLVERLVASKDRRANRACT